MRRQLLLLGGLAAAVALAVLLRTASPAVEQVAVAEPVEPGNAVVAEVAVADCSIATERTPGLISSEAAQPLPLVPLAAADIAVSRIADARSKAVTPSAGATVPRPQHQFLRITIRPPPASSFA